MSSLGLCLLAGSTYSVLSTMPSDSESSSSLSSVGMYNDPRCLLCCGVSCQVRQVLYHLQTHHNRAKVKSAWLHYDMWDAVYADISAIPNCLLGYSWKLMFYFSFKPHIKTLSQCLPLSFKEAMPAFP